MSMGIVTNSDFEDALRSLGLSVEDTLPVESHTEVPEVEVVPPNDISDTNPSDYSPVSVVDTRHSMSASVVSQLFPMHGRNKGDVNIPESLRKIIGEESVINGRQSAIQLAEDFGISPSSVSAYAKGATSTTSYNKPKANIVEHINKSRRRYIKKASHVMNSALKAISQDKLDYTDAKDLSGIAKDMSVIIKNLEPQAVPVESTDKTPQFVIYAPQFKSETSFESIVVNE